MRHSPISCGRLAAILSIIVIASCRATPDLSAQQADSSWSEPVNFSQASDSFSDVPMVLCDKHQNVHVLWVERYRGQYGINYRTDAGGDWSKPTDVLLAASTESLSSIITDNNTLHVLWLTDNGVAYSKAPLSDASNPRSWRQPTILASAVSAYQFFVDEAGALYVFYVIPDAEYLTFDLYFHALK